MSLRLVPPDVVSVHVWRVPRTSVPWAMAHVAGDRRRLRRQPGATFAKLLGTGSGRTFGPTDADLTRWVAVVAWDSRQCAEAFERSRVVRAWDAHSAERLRLLLRPVASRGSWSGRQPFEPRAEAGSTIDDAGSGPVAAITRARLTPSRARRFWAAVPPVAADLRHREGLRLAFGIGEAPVGWQGTLSVWRDSAALREFAYQGLAHTAVLEETARAGWYAEELFARFAVADVTGTVDGAAP